LEKTYRNGYRGTRRRLVAAFIFLFFYLPVSIYPADTQESFEYNTDKLSLMDGAEIESWRNTRIHQTLFSYLFFIPGPCALLILLFNKRNKKLSVLLLFLFISLLGKLTYCNREYIEKGLGYYYSGSIKNALTAFQMSEEISGNRPGISYNMALCYYKLGKCGIAISELFKAIKMAPMNNRIRRVLKLIEEKCNLTSQISPRPYLNPDISFIFILIFFNLSCIVLGLVFTFRKGQLVILFIFCVLCTLGSLSTYIFTQLQLNEQIGIITVSSAMLKKIPLSTSKTWVTLKEGASLKVLGKAKEYLLVKTGRGIKGWIKESSVRVI